MKINVSEDERFILRSAGIFATRGQILLHRAENDEFWTLPGGGCNFFEETQLALIREFEEELKATIAIDPLFFAVENFFTWAGQRVHEIGFYYSAEFVGESTQFYFRDEFQGIETEENKCLKLFFKWFPVSEVSQLNIKPDFLRAKLPALSKAQSHIINRST